MNVPINKGQLVRSVRRVVRLQENRYPNCASFADELRQENTDGKFDLSCTEKTIDCDIHVLKKDLPRIKSVHTTGEVFVPKKAIIKSASEDFIFDSEMASNVKVQCDKYLTKLIETRPLHPEQIVKVNDDGTSEVTVKKISKCKLTAWIMHQCGRAELIAPKELRNKIANFAASIEAKHGKAKGLLKL